MQKSEETTLTDRSQ